MADIRSVLGLLVISLSLRTVPGNVPPTMSMTRDWSLQEDEPVGSVVTRIQGLDDDGDPLTFDLGKAHIGEDGSYLFTVDHMGVVRLAKPLTGLANKVFFVSVTASDGHIPTRTEARVSIGPKDGKPLSHGGGLMAALNPNSGPAAPWLPPQGINPFNNPSRNRFGGGPGRQKPSIPSIDSNPTGGSPPLLNLPPRWMVFADAELHSTIAVVDAFDPNSEDFSFSVADTAGLVAIDAKTGQVTVKKLLTDQVGDHHIVVSVTNKYATIDGEVLLQVMPSEDTPTLPAVVRPTLPVARDGVHGGTTSVTQPSARDGVHGGTTSVTQPSARDGVHGGTTFATRPTLIVIDRNLPSPPPTTPPPPPSGSEGPSTVDAPSGSGNSSVVVVVVVAVGVAMSLFGGSVMWWCCKETKINVEKGKEASVRYDKKSLELSPASSASNSLSRQEAPPLRALPSLKRFWLRRASENKYEDGQAPSVPPRPGSGKNSSHGSLRGDASLDEWEFPRHKLRWISILGEGCFGQVWKYEATDLQGAGKTFVAIKTLKESAGSQERKDLQQELRVLKSLGKHPNVVSLLACCTEKEPTLVVLEYMVNGKLQTYLRDRRAKEPYSNLHGSSSTLSPRDLTIFALQVARGMQFLSTHGIVHRDLAARNVLVGENKVCKVADFGFARDLANNHVYERKSSGRLPIRWMALESLFDNIFTTKTDVWSFGILLWEIVTLGSTPYPGMSAEEVMKKIKEGYRLEKPSYCKREMYNIMFSCWEEDARERPSFKDLIKQLEGLITSEVDYIELNNFPDRSYYNIATAPASGELL